MATSPHSSEERTTEEQNQQQHQSAKEMTHKTKVIQFLGRTTPIILQNDNGPCPLLAICNVLLLKNNLNLSPDIPEISQEKLLSLIAERLIDSNSNINNKDAGYIENQQQNISDAIDLLPRLTTGIDVNIKFRRIGDFEFTRECAIFDLLDIPLYHGWIVDPQDCETANAIDSKSYNALTGELVALESRNMEGDNRKNSEEDSVDFAAATTATLGVPSPCLSRGESFDESPCSISNHYTRKGDIEEEAELLRVLKLSEAEMEPSAGDIFAVNNNVQTSYVNSNEMTCITDSQPAVHVEKVETNMLGENLKSTEQEMSILDDSSALNNHSNDRVTCQTAESGAVCISSKPDKEMSDDQSISEAFVGHVCKDVAGRIDLDAAIKNDNNPLDSSQQVPSPVSASHMCNSGGDEINQRQSTCKADIDETENNQSCCKTLGFSDLSVPVADSNSPSDRRQNIDASGAFSSSVDDSEPIYEGEECILDSRTTGYEDREPMYEGEVVLAKQVDKGSMDTYDADSKDEITPKQGELIRNFLKNSASQLTVYGLFCLQDGLKEREICVFFRNNHFNTMFKYEGELYILATDQGYLNQPDLVWEKLNEVNGDTVYMTSIFKEFKVEDQANSTWDEQNAMDSTADYIFSIDNSDELHSSVNSDLEYAIALQRQEFDQQPQRNMQQSTVTTGSKLVTGPQVSRNSPRSSSSSSRQETKSTKDKCTLM